MTTTAWAWQNPDSSIQEDTFHSCYAALQYALNRTNKETYEQLKELGFTLCRVKITVEVISCLN